MATYLLTWNPEIWDGDVASEMSWSCGQTKRIVSGDRLFIMRQSREPRGICGSGWAVSNAIPADSDEHVSRLYVKLRVDMFRDPMTESILTREELKELNSGVDHPMKWDIQSSGTEIPVQVAQRLEEAWQKLCGGDPLYPDELPLAGCFVEGASRIVRVNAYERDPKARPLCLAAHGTNCHVCNFNFEAVYGKVAEGFIHVHHLHPLSEVGEEHVVDPVADLRPVCPNCHAVLHRRVPALNIEELQALMEWQKNLEIVKNNT